MALMQLSINGEVKADEFVFRAIKEYKGDCVADCMSGKLVESLSLIQKSPFCFY